MEGKERKCSDCDKTFSTKHNYDRHVRVHTGEKPFKCSKCDKYFKHEESLKIHKVLHTGVKPFKCTFCDKQFSFSTRLHWHLFTHTGYPHKCPICPRRFGYPKQLEVHSRVHTGERPFKCNDCDMGFISKGKLAAHTQVHNPEKSFSCDHCPKKYRYKTHLNSHVRIHTGVYFKCKNCDFQTLNGNNLLEHTKHAHDSSHIFCTICLKTFKWKGGLERHILRVHTGERPFECKICGKGFSSFNRMEACIRKHYGETPPEDQINYKPEMVEEWLSNGRPSDHEGDKDFHHCPHSPKKFERKENLTEHLVTHDGGNHKCTFCPEEFISSSRLDLHLRLHTGEKPFKCQLCPYRSTVAVGKVHMLCHEKEEEFNCRLCTFSSGRHDRILQHEQKDHGYYIDSLENNSGAALMPQTSQGALESQPLACKECKFCSFNDEYLSIHYSQCHG